MYFLGDNIELINFVIDKLEIANVGFVCDHIVKEAIRCDLVDIIKRLINNRWHIITENDELHAQLIDGDCHRFFMERSKALHYIDTSNLNMNNVIDLDDDEWEDNDEKDSKQQQGIDQGDEEEDNNETDDTL